MIILGLLECLFALLQVLFSWLMLPDFPITISNYLYQVMHYITEGLPVLWVFLDKEVTTACLVLALACQNFDKLYYFLMWIIAKLPLGISKE